jgi:hypothetical protein
MDIRKATSTSLTKDKAQSVCDKLNADSDGWEYRLNKNPIGWGIIVYDEDGTLMGSI